MQGLRGRAKRLESREAEKGGWERRQGLDHVGSLWAPLKTGVFSWMQWKTTKGFQEGGQHEEGREHQNRAGMDEDWMGLEGSALG